MNYYELTFTYTSPVETSIINDVLAAELGEIGFESFAENENGLQGYISDQLYNVNGKRTISSRSASARIASSAPPSTNMSRVMPIISSSTRRWHSEPATTRQLS